MKYNTTSDNRSHLIQTGSHTIFHSFILTCILISTAVAIHTQMYRLLKFSVWTLLLRTNNLHGWELGVINKHGSQFAANKHGTINN